jgi:signal transduction histidine kinase
MSIRLRLTLWYTAVTMGTILACSTAVYVFVSYSLYEAEKETMQRLGERVFAQIDVTQRYNLFLGTTVTLALPELQDFRYSGCYLQIVDARGQVQDQTADIALPVPPEASAPAGFTTPFFRHETILSYPFLTYTIPLRIDTPTQTDQSYVGAVQIATLLTDVEQSLAVLRWILTMVGLTTLAFASSLGWFLARQALRPIEVVMGETQRIGQARSLQQRIQYDGPDDEIGRLTRTINSMLAQLERVQGELEEANQAQRRFISDASHELRTPLTTIRGNVEWLEKIWKKRTHARVWEEPTAVGEPAQQMVEAAIQDVVAEAQRMSRMVNDLLTLARSDIGHRLVMQPLGLLAIVEEVGRQAVHLPHQVDWKIGDLDALADVDVRGNADAIKQLLYILIENAFQYTDEGEVVLDALMDAGRRRVGLRVRDTGIGIAKEHVPHIFERLYRIDASRGRRSGSGLGLAIARWIIDEHQGTIEVYTREKKGTTMIAWFPLDKANGIG